MFHFMQREVIYQADDEREKKKWCLSYFKQLILDQYAVFHQFL